MSSLTWPATIDALNRTADSWARYVLHAGWQGTGVVIFVVLTARLGRKWPAPLRAALLCVALLKLLVPPMASLPIGIFCLAESMTEHLATRSTPLAGQPLATTEQIKALEPAATGPIFSTPQSQTASRAPNLSAMQPPSLAVRLTLTAKLMLLHLGGMLVLAGFVAFHRLRLQQLVKHARRQTCGDVYERMLAIAARLSVRPPRELLVTGQKTPATAFGLFRRRIMLPESLLASLDVSAIDAVLAHELAHHRRHDPAITLMQLLAVTLWWFNPFVWFLGRELRQTREECCDDIVIGERIASRAQYCNALVDALAQMNAWRCVHRTFALGEPMHPVGVRMTRIMDPSVRGASRLSRWMILCLLLFAALVLPGARLHGQAAPLPNYAAATHPAAPSENGDEVRIEKVVVGSEAIMVSAAMDSDHEVVLEIHRPFEPRRWKFTTYEHTFEGNVASNRVGGANEILLQIGPGHGKIENDLLIRSEELWGNFTLRPETDCVMKNGIVMFADVVAVDGTKWPVSISVQRKQFTSEGRYNIDDLVVPGGNSATGKKIGDAIAKLIQETIDPATWGAGKSVIRMDGSTLVVTQTEDNQRRIAAFVDQLRRTHYRGVVAAEPSPEAKRRIALDQSVGQLAFRGNSFEEAIRLLSNGTGETIYVHWKALEAAKVVKTLPVTTDLSNLPLDRALGHLLEAVGGSTVQLAYSVESNAIIVSTVADLAKDTLTQVYDIRRAIRSQESRADDVAAIIRRVRGIDPLSWKEAGGVLGSVREMTGQLIITQTPGNHKRIETELRGLCLDARFPCILPGAHFLRML